MTSGSWKVNLLLVCFGLAVGLGAVEVAARAYEHFQSGSQFESVDDLRRAMLVDADSGNAGEEVELRELLYPHPSDSLIYDLRPDIDVVFQRVNVRTNSCGMRDTERSQPKPANTYRIALLGDSFAFGWGVNQEKIFSRVLENTLNESSKNGTRFEVLNFGIPGYSTFQEVSLFKDRVIDFDPDEVLVYFVQNDFGYPFFVRDIQNPGQMLSAVRFARLTWEEKDPKIEQQRLELMKLDPNTAFKELSDVTRELGIKLSVVFNPRKDWKSDYQRIPILRKRKDIRILKLRKPFLAMMDSYGISEQELTLSWDPHPSEIRHWMLGKLLSQYYLEVGA